MRIVAGDIGGTKTWLALYETEGGSTQLVRRSRYSSADFQGLAPMVREFLPTERADVDGAVFGVAGPVIDNTCKATNLPWQLDGNLLERELSIAKVRLINDFHAIALGIPTLEPDELAVLQHAETDPSGPWAILGAGTGLGVATVLPTDEGLRVLPSEGGHVDFAPRNADEIGLLEFLRKKHRRVSYERVVSGPGLGALFEFVATTGLARVSPEVAERMRTEDPAAVVTEFSDRDAACGRALDMFVSLYGAMAGNLALTVLPTGGLYLAGGIAPRIVSRLQGDSFLRSFLDKGRMSPLLENLRVCVIRDAHVGLAGARNLALQLEKSGQ